VGERWYPEILAQIRRMQIEEKEKVEKKTLESASSQQQKLGKAVEAH
jgi:predicted transposase YdaD